MPNVAREGDAILGVTTGEHHGHALSPHPPCTLNGTINVPPNSRKVFVNGKQIALKGDRTIENDCCGPGNGSIAVGSDNVFVNGVPVARKGDNVSPHNGTAEITGGSPNVFVN